MRALALPLAAVVVLAGSPARALPAPAAHPAAAVPAAAPATPTPTATPRGIRVPFIGLNMAFQPAAHKLLGIARLRLDPEPGAPNSASFLLDAGLKVMHVTLNRRPVTFERDGERLDVDLPIATRAGTKWVLAIAYAGRPLQATRNQTLQDVGPEAVVLQPRGHWFPEPQGGGESTATLTLKLPAGWRASAPTSRQTFDLTHAVAHLEYTPGAPLALVAAPLQVYGANGVTCYLQNSPGDVPLTRGEKLLELFRDHGIPATGPRVIVELPAAFAPISAAGWVAMARPAGPLALWLAGLPWQPREGASTPGRLWLTHSLVAYATDLLTLREKGQAAYRKALRKRLAEYETFLRHTPAADLPLDGAIAPDSPAWEQVVDNKGALVWSLVHDELGDKDFWSLLRGLHAAVARGEASVKTFQAIAGRRLDFVTSWLAEPGLPRFRIEDTHVEGKPGDYQVFGVLTQVGPPIETPLELALITQDQVNRVHFQSFGDRVPFHFTSASRPLRVAVDPGERLPLARVRRVWVADALSQPNLIIVYGSQGDAAEVKANEDAAQQLARHLAPRLGALIVVADRQLTASQRRGPLALVGRPSSNALLAAWEDQLPVRYVEEGKGLWWQGRDFTGAHEGVMQAIPNPDAPGQMVAVLSAVAPTALVEGLRYAERRATFCLYDGPRVLEEGEVMPTFPDLDAVLY